MVDLRQTEYKQHHPVERGVSDSVASVVSVAAATVAKPESKAAVYFTCHHKGHKSRLVKFV